MQTDTLTLPWRFDELDGESVVKVPEAKLKTACSETKAMTNLVSLGHGPTLVNASFQTKHFASHQACQVIDCSLWKNKADENVQIAFLTPKDATS